MMDNNNMTDEIISKYPSFTSFTTSSFFAQIKDQPCRLRMYLEIYLKRHLNETKGEFNHNYLKSTNDMLSFVISNILNTTQSIEKDYPVMLIHY